MKPGDLHVSGLATFCGWQPSFPMHAGLELWNLTQSFPHHPEHSTVTRETLDSLIADTIEQLRCRVAALEIVASGEMQSETRTAQPEIRDPFAMRHPELFTKLP